MASSKVRDPLYGFIELPELLIPFINHELFQRLRWVNQLPLEQLVYPSANHSRFEHSLGVMHLASIVFDAMLNNSKKEFELLLKSILKENGFGIKTKNYILVKYGFQLAALYHDIGHAPFSHTFEDACKFSSERKYDHEEIGFYIAQKIFNTILRSQTSTTKDCKLVIDIATKILNKKIKTSDLADFSVFRNLIDGPIDIDKGDYILRDSYHCGVNYGTYDYKRLWENVLYSDVYWKYLIDDRAATEVWRLRLARFFMYENVYKHKFRNKTDALLIDIIADYFKNPASDNKLSFTSLLFKGEFGVESLDNFLLWNDQSFINTLQQINDLKSAIEKFLKRDIKFKLIEIDINKELKEYINHENKINKELYVKLNEFKSNKLNVYFLIYKKQNNPVFEPETIKEILIKTKNNKKSIADYYNFNIISDEDLLLQNKYVLYVYFENNQFTKNEILGFLNLKN